ncbi:MAG: hypothetical protein M1831_004892 [Alyxoria varia]|nr:MAG: hypothetical protein M1831_004892 [Alyxoria varia]
MDQTAASASSPTPSRGTSPPEHGNTSGDVVVTSASTTNWGGAPTDAPGDSFDARPVSAAAGGVAVSGGDLAPMASVNSAQTGNRDATTPGSTAEYASKGEDTSTTAASNTATIVTMPTTPAETWTPDAPRQSATSASAAGPTVPSSSSLPSTPNSDPAPSAPSAPALTARGQPISPPSATAPRTQSIKPGTVKAHVSAYTQRDETRDRDRDRERRAGKEVHVARKSGGKSSSGSDGGGRGGAGGLGSAGGPSGGSSGGSGRTATPSHPTATSPSDAVPKDKEGSTVISSKPTRHWDVKMPTHAPTGKVKPKGSATPVQPATPADVEGVEGMGPEGFFPTPMPRAPEIAWMKQSRDTVLRKEGAGGEVVSNNKIPGAGGSEGSVHVTDEETSVKDRQAQAQQEHMPARDKMVKEKEKSVIDAKDLANAVEDMPPEVSEMRAESTRLKETDEKSGGGGEVDAPLNFHAQIAGPFQRHLNGAIALLDDILVDRTVRLEDLKARLADALNNAGAGPVTATAIGLKSEPKPKPQAVGDDYEGCVTNSRADEEDGNTSRPDENDGGYENAAVRERDVSARSRARARMRWLERGCASAPAPGFTVTAPALAPAPAQAASGSPMSVSTATASTSPASASAFPSATTSAPSAATANAPVTTHHHPPCLRRHLQHRGPGPGTATPTPEEVRTRGSGSGSASGTTGEVIEASTEKKKEKKEKEKEKKEKEKERHVHFPVELADADAEDRVHLPFEHADTADTGVCVSVVGGEALMGWLMERVEESLGEWVGCSGMALEDESFECVERGVGGDEDGNERGYDCVPDASVHAHVEGKERGFVGTIKKTEDNTDADIFYDVHDRAAPAPAVHLTVPVPPLPVPAIVVTDNMGRSSCDSKDEKTDKSTSGSGSNDKKTDTSTSHPDSNDKKTDTITPGSGSNDKKTEKSTSGSGSGSSGSTALPHIEDMHDTNESNSKTVSKSKTMSSSKRIWENTEKEPEWVHR